MAILLPLSRRIFPALICAACFARAKGETRKSLQQSTLRNTRTFWNAISKAGQLRRREPCCPAWSGITSGARPKGRTIPTPRKIRIAETSSLPIVRRALACVFPAKEVVDAGFLELVRHGIRSADDPIIVDSLKVIDSVLKVDTPFGPCWRRYNHDGYGQRDDGTAFVRWGRGRAWPLLTGERGHYELAAGHDTAPFIRAMEKLASSTGLLPEQSWDSPDKPDSFMYCGRPTGSAMPLMWAHAEYIKLLRSVRDGKVYDRVPDVANWYLGNCANRCRFEIWKPMRRVRSVKNGYILRIQMTAAFRLHWSDDEWHTVKDTPSASTTLGVEFVDIPTSRQQRAPIHFTFFWTKT